MTSTPPPPPPAREPVRYPWLWVGYGLCLAFGIPWYREAGVIDPVVAGFPLWALVSALSCVGVAALTGVAVLRLWSDPAEGDPTEPADPPAAAPTDPEEGLADE